MQKRNYSTLLCDIGGVMDNTLTAKEQRILELVQQGLTNYQIAVAVNTNPNYLTKRHLKSIKRKLGVNSKEEMIALKREESCSE